MKCLFQEDRELIKRARRDGREARGNEEREKREDSEREQREDREKRKEEDTNRQFENEGLRDHLYLEFSRSDPAISIVSSSPQGMISWNSSIKIWFLQAYRMHY